MSFTAPAHVPPDMPRTARLPPRLRRAGLSAIAALTAVGLAGSTHAARAGDLAEGVWYDDTGRGAIEIKPCGPGLCGAVVWLQEPREKTGAPVTDDNNPEPAKRARPICGLPIFGNAKRQPDGAWDEGWIYDPKTGNSYDLALALETRDRLTVTGYKGVKMFSQSFTWKRAPVTLPRCDSTAAAAGTAARQAGTAPAGPAATGKPKTPAGPAVAGPAVKSRPVAPGPAPNPAH